MTSPAPSIEIPADALVLIVGMPGSGKSTFVQRNFAPEEISSLDIWRERLGRPGDHEATPEAVHHADREIAERLARGEIVAVDNTNLEAVHRQRYARMARERGRPVVVILIDTPVEHAIGRNRARSGHRRVPDEVMTGFARQWEQTLETIGAEGLGVVHRLDPHARASLRLHRRATAPG